MLPPLGAQVPASRTFRISSRDTGSGFSRRIDRVVRIISNRSALSVAPGVGCSVILSLARKRRFRADHSAAPAGEYQALARFVLRDYVPARTGDRQTPRQTKSSKFCAHSRDEESAS